MDYEKINEAKACFDNVYTAPTPHTYIAMMAKNGYEIGEQARPYCVAAAELLREKNKDVWPVQILDIGCSYGMGSAFIKYGCSFDEMVAFFSTRAPKDPDRACEAMRAWLNVIPPSCDVRCVGLDSSAPAIRFAMKAGLLDGGIMHDFEHSNSNLNDEERSWVRSCNLMISTGAIGYITDRTMRQVVRHIGKDHPSEFGPLAVHTILRMFDSDTIKTVFENQGFMFEKVPGIMLPQRSFTDEEERESVIAILQNKGIDTAEWEDRGKHFAELYISAPAAQFPELLDRMIKTRALRTGGNSDTANYIRR